MIYFSVKIYVSSEKRHERLFIKYLITVISLLSSATLNDAKIYTLVWWRNGVPPQTLRGNGVHSRISQPRIKEIFVSFWILKMHQSKVFLIFLKITFNHKIKNVFLKKIIYDSTNKFWLEKDKFFLKIDNFFLKMTTFTQNHKFYS